jgi:hypothetical protein
MSLESAFYKIVDCILQKNLFLLETLVCNNNLVFYSLRYGYRIFNLVIHENNTEIFILLLNHNFIKNIYLNEPLVHLLWKNQKIEFIIILLRLDSKHIINSNDLLNKAIYIESTILCEQLLQHGAIVNEHMIDRIIIKLNMSHGLERQKLELLYKLLYDRYGYSPVIVNDEDDTKSCCC